jgi:hypothetical protein
LAASSIDGASNTTQKVIDEPSDFASSSFDGANNATQSAIEAFLI